MQQTTESSASSTTSTKHWIERSLELLQPKNSKLTLGELETKLLGEGYEFDGDNVQSIIKSALSVLQKGNLIRRFNANMYGSKEQTLAQSTPAPAQAPIVQTPVKPTFSQFEGQKPSYVGHVAPVVGQSQEQQIRTSVFGHMNQLTIVEGLLVMEKVIQKRTQADTGGELIGINVIGTLMAEFAKENKLVRWRRASQYVGQGTAYAKPGVKPPDNTWYLAS